MKQEARSIFLDHWRGVLIFLAAVPILAMACRFGSGDDNEVIIFTRTPVPAATPTVVATPVPLPTIPPTLDTPSPAPDIPLPTITPTPSPTPDPNVCLFNPDPATEGEIQLQSPLLAEIGQVLDVQSPLVVTGWGSRIASDDLQGVTVALVDGQGSVQLTRFVQPQPVTISEPEGEDVPPVDQTLEPTATVEATSEPEEVLPTATPPADEGVQPPEGLTVTEFTAPFSTEVTFQVTGPLSVCLWVFEQPVGSSQSQNVVQVPLRLVPSALGEQPDSGEAGADDGTESSTDDGASGTDDGAVESGT